MRVVFLFILLITNIYGCKSAKEDAFAKNPPFTVEKVTVEESETEILLNIIVTNIKRGVSIDEIHFRSKIAPVLKDGKNGYHATLSKKNDVMMSNNDIEEATNLPPQISPFTTDEDQAIIGYRFRDMKNYVEVPVVGN